MRRVDVGLALTALTTGAVAALGWVTEAPGWTQAPGGWATFLGREAGLLGTWFAIISVFLAARLPSVERRLGHDRLLHAHRRLGTSALTLIVAHAALITLGYAQADGVDVFHEAWLIVTWYPEMFKGTAAWLLFVTVGVLAIPQVRAQLRYVTWWALHLLTYAAVFLALGHQLANGAAFVGHPMASRLWQAMTYGVLLLVLWGRALSPLLRSLRHDLRVTAITRESADVVTVTVAGRHLRRLKARAGQYFLWRFLTHDLWWRAHPYSLSSAPDGRHLRITVREVGQHSRALARLRPGTRVLVEGPYGRFHSGPGGELHRQPLLLVAGGVGIGPVRALLEAAGAGSRTVVVYRARHELDVLFAHELTTLAREYDAGLFVLTGSRQRQPLDAQRLLELLPDVRRRTVFVCGPEPLVDGVRAAAADLGIPPERVHAESFAFLPPARPLLGARR